MCLDYALDQVSRRFPVMQGVPLELYPPWLYLSWYFREGNSEIGAHARKNLFYLIGLRHLIRLRVVSNRFFLSPKRPIFLHACTTCSELPYNISRMKLTEEYGKVLDLLHHGFQHWSRDQLNMVLHLEINFDKFPWRFILLRFLLFLLF